MPGADPGGSMVNQPEFQEALRSLRALDPAADDLAHSLRRIVEAAQSLPGADQVGLMLLDPYGQLCSVSGTGPASLALGQLQRELGEGPSVTALATDDVVVASDASTDKRWPALARMLRHQRVRAVISLPVHLRGRPHGTLDLVAEQPRQAGPTDVDAAGAVADVLAEFLDAAARADERAGRVQQLEREVTARVLVEQAKGVVMERAGLSGPEAFTQLRTMARASRRKLVDVAQIVLDERHLVGNGPGGDWALERVTRVALTRLALDRLLVDLLAPLRSLADADAVVIQLLSEDGQELEARAVSGLGPEVEGMRTPLAGGLSGQAVSTHVPLFVAELAHSFKEPALAGSEVQSAGAVPVLFKEQPIGALVVGRTERRPFSLGDRERLTRAAERVGAAVAGARLDQLAATAQARTRVANERLRRLRAVSAALSGALTPAAVVRAVVEEGVAAFDGNGGVVVVPAGDGQLEVVGSTGHGDDLAGGLSRFPLSAPVALAEAARQGHPVWLHDPAEWDERYPENAGLLGGPHQASASVPLRAQGRFLGIFGVSFDQVQAFDENDRLYLLALADELAAALDRAHLYELAHREREEAVAAQQRLAFLAEASALLATSLDPQVTLDQIAWLAVPKLADICLVLLVEDDVLYPAAVAYNDTATLEPLDRMLSSHLWQLDAGSLFGDILLAGRSRLWTEQGDEVPTDAAEDTAKDEAQLAGLRQLEMASGMLVPLVGRSERMGMLAFGRQKGGRPYTATDLSLAEDLAVRAGTALDNARRYDLASRPRDPS
jgi:GAF domain-containing protein